MIIVHVGNKPIGLLADRVLDIVAVDANEIKPVPRVAQAQRLNFLSGLVTTENAMIALIDLPNFVIADRRRGRQCERRLRRHRLSFRGLRMIMFRKARARGAGGQANIEKLKADIADKVGSAVMMIDRDFVDHLPQ